MAGKRINAVDLYIAKRLRVARALAGKSQEEAAEHLDLTFQQVQKYEKGTNRISCGKLALLAPFYGKTVAWFFDGAPVDEATATATVVDIGARFMEIPGGVDLARDFVAIADDHHRQAVVRVARSLAHASQNSR